MENYKHGDTVLHKACKSKNPSLDTIISKLIKIGGRNLVTKKNWNGDTALSVALMNESATFDIISKLILEMGGRGLVMEINRYGDTVLHKVCRWFT